jgi:site-specific DNA-cytosine methylase
MADGFSRGLDKGKRLKALGNAVVPQVAELIGQMILAQEEARCAVGD